ncbi:MAG: hypothetical protein NC434_03035 [Ruminococcus sp.]|nr:hypothetical protein [Ruminococcus sp.]
MKTAFEKVVLTGYGRIAGEVLSYVIDRQEDYGYRIEFIEHESNPFPLTEKICMQNDIPFRRIEDKKELAAHYDKMQGKTLIVSASNNFLFPESLVSKENITIINFHNALLPDYPGRNAPSWVIFMGEKESGITWHYVTAGIDEGNIIIQKKCEITADMKAYELAGKLMEIAYEAFVSSFEAVLEERVQTRAQKFAKDRRMYRSYEVPADGFFALTQEAADIYRLLRSTDYGKNDIFPHMQTQIEGRRAEVLRYRRIQTAEAVSRGDAGYGLEMSTKQEGFLYFPLDRENVLRIKFRFIED